jgi:hypothetical protein
MVLRSLFRAPSGQGLKDLVFYGGGDAAELAYIFAQEIGLELVGLVDAEQAGRRFLDHVVLDPAALPRLEYDCVVMTSFDDGVAVRRELQAMGGLHPGSSSHIARWCVQQHG